MKMYERNGRGSIPLFGACEENGGCGFPGMERMKQRLNEALLYMEIAAVFGAARSE